VIRVEPHVLVEGLLRPAQDVPLLRFEELFELLQLGLRHCLGLIIPNSLPRLAPLDEPAVSPIGERALTIRSVARVVNRPTRSTILGVWLPTAPSSHAGSPPGSGPALHSS